MKISHNSRILRFIYGHEQLARAYHWLVGNWLLLIIYVLFVVVVLCMVDLAIMVLTT